MHLSPATWPARALAAAALVAFAVLAATACAGDDGGAGPSPAATTSALPSGAPASASPGSSPPTATPTATPGPGEQLARSAAYILYVAGEGDTVTAVAAAFSAAPGSDPAGLAASIRQDNSLGADALPRGAAIAVPLRLPGTLAMLPENSLEAALGVGVQGKGGPLLLLQPGLALREGYLGRLLLHRVQLATGAPSAEGYGYVMEYWTADRPVVKGGGLDPEASIAEAQFIVAAGSLAASLTSSRPGDLQAFTRDGVPYAVKALGGTLTAAQVAAGLQPASER